jgi:hypothetical protein
MQPRSLVPTSLAIAAALLLWATAACAADRSDCTPADARAAHPVGLVNWDARRWQRHRVWITLDADNPGDAPANLLPEMVVDARPDGSAAAVLRGLPMMLAPHARATQRLAVYVPDDTRTLGVRTLAATPVSPDPSRSPALSFALDCSDARFDMGEFAPAVAASLDEAIETYLNGLDDPISDPNAAAQAARALSSGAQDATDVVWTVRGLMQVVHDDHSFIVGPGEPSPARRTLVTRAPELELRTDGVAVVRLHAVDTRAAADALAWATALHDGIAALAARHPHGWIIDLRDHDGDSPWPSFAGLSTLLDGPLVGAYVSRRDKQDWIVERGVARVAGGPALVDVQAAPEPAFRGPVAVLIGPNTRDAGEDVTVALRGRMNTRFFGAPTAGFPTLGIAIHRLRDGTTLGVLETRDADRTGVIHRLAIEPETLLKDGAILDGVPRDALDWVLDSPAADPAAR